MGTDFKTLFTFINNRDLNHFSLWYCGRNPEPWECQARALPQSHACPEPLIRRFQVDVLPVTNPAKSVRTPKPGEPHRRTASVTFICTENSHQQQAGCKQVLINSKEQISSGHKQ